MELKAKNKEVENDSVHIIAEGILTKKCDIKEFNNCRMIKFSLITGRNQDIGENYYTDFISFDERVIKYVQDAIANLNEGFSSKIEMFVIADEQVKTYNDSLGVEKISKSNIVKFITKGFAE